MCSPYERYFFKSTILKHIEANVNNSKKVSKLNKEIKEIKESNSYRIGRIITMPIRKIKGGIRCMRDHGIKYTCKLTIKKIKAKLWGNIYGKNFYINACM